MMANTENNQHEAPSGRTLFVLALAVAIPVFMLSIGLVLAAGPALPFFATFMLSIISLGAAGFVGIGLYNFWVVGRTRLMLAEVEARRIRTGDNTAEGFVDLKRNVVIPPQIQTLVPTHYAPRIDITGEQPGALAQAGLVQAAPAVEAWPEKAKLTDYVQGNLFKGGELYLMIGLNGQGQSVGAGVYDLSHFMIGGISGAGKSVFVRSLVFQALLAELDQTTAGNVLLAIIDRSKITFNPDLFKGLPQLWRKEVAQNDEQALMLLADMKAECDRRGGLFAQLARQGLYPEKLQEYNAAVPPASRLPLILVLCEEWNALCEANPKFKKLGYQLSIEARKYGIYLVALGQNFTKDAVGAMRDQFATRVYFGEMQPETRSMLQFPRDLIVKIAKRGRGLVRIPGRPAQEVQGFFVDKDDLVRLVNFLKEKLNLGGQPTQPEAAGAADTAQGEEKQPAGSMLLLPEPGVFIDYRKEAAEGRLEPNDWLMLQMVLSVEQLQGYASLQQLFQFAKGQNIGGEKAIALRMQRLKELGLVDTTGPRGSYQLTELGRKVTKVE